MTAEASPEGDEATRGLEEALNQESRRLEKLWDAYKAQEHELQDALARVKTLEASLAEKDGAIEDAEARASSVAEEKDAEIARLNAEVERLQQQVSDVDALREEVKAVEAYRARVDELEEAYSRERERLAKLYLVYEELQEEVERLRGKDGAASDASSE